MSKINYVQGDATNPQLLPNEIGILVHCVNDIGIMGSGIALAISKKWPNVLTEYQNLFKLTCKTRATAQGQIQYVSVEDNLVVCNLFGQSMMGEFDGLPAVRYGAVKEGFLRIRHDILKRTPDYKTQSKTLGLHMPRICCERAGGSWSRIEDILDRVFKDFDNEDAFRGITVYDFPGSHFNP